MNKKITREIFMYVFFGALTTLINTVAYWVLYYGISVPNTTSTIISWLLSVIFAYITNKLWVFEKGNKSTLKEATEFFLSRISTGVLDLFIMYVGVELLLFEGGIIKILSNVVVIILNYLLSKLFVFKKS